MLVVIRSSPDTTDGSLGLTLAKKGGADLVLLQNGVYFARKERLGAFTGSVYVLEDDTRLRGIKVAEMDDRVKLIDYEALTDLVTSGDKVAGMF